MDVAADPTLPGTPDDDAAAGDGPGSPIARGSVIGRYTVLSVLGRGGMGVVYRAWDPALDRPVALKVMLAGRFAAQRQIARFLDEARAIARLDDPALVAVHDVGVVDGCPFFTMEHVDGESLAAVLAVEGPFAPSRSVRVAVQVARGLEHAHGQGVVHRDIKPANVLLDDQGARVIDFGIARLLESDDGHTRTGQVLGTPAYMAPEQAAGRRDAVAPTIDVYGAGGLLYEMLTGLAPRSVARDAPLKGADHPAVPRDLLAICNRALATEPDDRYPTASALADDLDRFLRGQPVEAALPGSVRRLGWWVRRSRRVLLTAGLTALVVGATIAGVAYWRAERGARAAAARVAQRETIATERLTRSLEEARLLRAQGETARAEQLEYDAALHLDVQGTRALARFHLTRAGDASGRGETEQALGAASTAYAVAGTSDDRHAAMIALGHLFVDQRDASALAELLATIVNRFPDRADERARLALYDRVFAGRLSEAAERAETAEPDWAPLLRALGYGTRTAHHLPELSVTRDLHGPWLSDVTGDARPELWTGGMLLSTGDPSLPRVPWPDPPTDLGPDTRIRPIDGMPGTFTTLNRSPGLVLRHDGAAWRTLTTARLRDDLLIAVDLDLDGQPEVYSSTAPGMRTLLPGPGPDDPWRSVVSDPGLDGAGAFLKATRSADWGGPLLLLASGGWQAYDLRIYRSAGDGRLALAARRQIGTLADAIVLPDARGRRLVAAATRSPAVDQRFFHPDDDRLLPDGVHIFEWTDDGIEHRMQLAQSPGDRSHARMWAGDVDGDGLSDLVTLVISQAVPRYTVVHRRLPDGWAPPLPLLGFYPFGLADVDGDGDAELLANDLASGQLWVLGAGDSPLPRRPMPSPLPIENEGRVSAIADLVALGRLEEALQAWRREMLLDEQPALAARQAARLAERLERHEEAAELYLRAAEAPEQAVAMLTAAADASRAARRPALQRAALARLVTESALDPDGQARARRRLAALDAADAARIAFDFAGGLHPSWRIRLPDRVSPDRFAGVLEAHADPSGESARMPLRRIADRVAVELHMQTPRVEYGGGLTVALVAPRPGGGEMDLAHISNHGWGGGSIVYQRVFADFGSRGHAVLGHERVVGTAGHPVAVYMEFDYRTGGLLIIDRRSGRRVKMTLDASDIGSELALVIRHPPWVQGGGAFVQARITEMTLHGVELAPPSDDPLYMAAIALADGWLDVALTVLGNSDGPAADAIRAAALYDRGRWDAADDQLRESIESGLDDPVFGQFLVGRLRRDPLHFAPLIRELLGLRADALLWRAYGTGFDKHADDPALVRAAEASLIGADEDPARIVEHPAPHMRLRLLLTRARMRHSVGERGGSRADLDRIEAALAALPQGERDETAFELQQLWTDVRLERAALEAVEDVNAAAAAVRAALAGSRSRGVTADRIRADDGLRRLADRPVWREVEAAAAGR